MSFWADLIKENKTPPAATLELDDVLCRAISKLVMDNRSLTSLDLSRNGLTDNSGVYIARMLGENSSLIKLELEANALGPKTAAALGDALYRNDSLVYLKLEGNPLTGQFAQEHTINGRAEFDGVQSLALTLSQNHTLTYLNLRRTGLGQKGGDAIAKA